MIDIIIATYNRPDIINNLVNDILSRNLQYVSKIIIVDSSDEINEQLSKKDHVRYIHSNHKNQPFQRFLGYRLSESEYLLYLDDDMLLLDDEIFNQIELAFKDPTIVGLNLLFTNKNDFLNNVAKHSYHRMPKWLVEFVHWVTSNPNLPDGKFWYCGCRGKRVDGGFSEYFSGGAFCARKSELYKDFDLSICTLFEKKIGMAEDVILAYTLSKQGKIFNLPKSYFFHDEPANSVYTTNYKAYNYRVAYSRLYLSLQYARLNEESRFKACVITAWYHIWRLAGLSLICLTHKSAKWSGFSGYLGGMLSSFKLLFNKSDNTYWLIESNKNLE